MSTPLINRPEVAIVGVNRIVERPVISEGEIMAAKLMNLSTSCDHRVVDGWDAANFIQAVKRLLETPVLLFANCWRTRPVAPASSYHFSPAAVQSPAPARPR